MLETLLMIICLVLLAALTVVTIAWRKNEQQIRHTQADNIRLNTQLNEQLHQQKKLEHHNAHLENEKQKSLLDQKRITELETQLIAQKQQNEEKINLLKNTEQIMSDRFQRLAQDILNHSEKKLNANNKIQLQPLIEPLNQQLHSFRQRLETLSDDNTKERAQLREHISQLQTKAQQVATDANNLTQALQNNKKIQGNWGELALQRLLDQSGLQKNSDYTLQTSLNNDQGQRLIPDCIIHLPDNRCLIIDAKVSMIDYLNYANAQNEPTRQDALKQHIDAIDRHIKQLADKHYAHAQSIQTPDFVFLFMHPEAAFFAALQQDFDLVNRAYRKKIVLTSPTTLMATLQTIAHLWQQQKQQQNAQDIARQGGLLYDKFCGFVKDLDEVGKSLIKTQQSYDSAYKKLSSGQGNLIGQTEKLQQLGVSHKKSLTVP